MSAIILNGTTYDGLSGRPCPPSTNDMTIAKIGKTMVNANGGRTFVARAVGGVPIRKRTWVLAWEKATSVERNAVRALVAVAAAFTYTDEEGTSYTVQVEEDDPYQHAPAFTKHDNSLLYDLSITLKEA
jgi:hypothetical protein